MGVLVILAVIIAIVALAIKSIKRQEAAAQEAAWAEEIEQKKEAERLQQQQQRLEEERLQQQQRLEDAGLSESCLQFAQRMKEHPMIVEEGQKLLQDDRPSGRIFSKTPLQAAENAL